MREDLFALSENERTNPIAFADCEVLKRAVAKIIVLGEQVGVSADQMITLLNSGLTVSELLQYLACRSGEEALGRATMFSA